MDTTTLLILGCVFVFSGSVAAFSTMAWGQSRMVEKRRIKKRLLYLSAGGIQVDKQLQLMKQSEIRDAGALGRFFLKLPRLHALDRLLLRSGAPFGVIGFFMLTIICGVGSYFGALAVLPDTVVALVLALIMGALPFLFLRSAEQRSLRKIEEQLPEALDLMTRALRAGHALATALELVAEDMDDPVRSEFGAMVDEIRYGLTVQDALTNMCNRVPLPDMRFFAITVALHKETGGNLTEVFEKIGSLIRGRQQFRRQVEALTAEGRFSAVIMLMIPTAMFIYLYLTNNSYVEPLWTDPIGRKMAGIGLAMQLVGYLLMRKMAKLEV